MGCYCKQRVGFSFIDELKLIHPIAQKLSRNADKMSNQPKYQLY